MDLLKCRQASDVTGVVEDFKEQATEKEINRMSKKIYESCFENAAGSSLGD